jgi:hypothetical protein
VNGALNIRGGSIIENNGTNITNTYMRFGDNGSGSDWINVRQIGGDNNITLCYDFTDDDTEVRFVLRNNPSASPTDQIPWEVLRIDNANNSLLNGTAQITQFRKDTQTSNPALALYNNNTFFISGHSLRFLTNTGDNAYNRIVEGGDKGIIYTNGTLDTGNFVIAPQSDTMSGIRMTSAGNVGIGKPNPAQRLDVSGSIMASAYFFSRLPDVPLRNMIALAYILDSGTYAVSAVLYYTVGK